MPSILKAIRAFFVIQFAFFLVLAGIGIYAAFAEHPDSVLVALRSDTMFLKGLFQSALIVPVFLLMHVRKRFTPILVVLLTLPQTAAQFYFGHRGASEVVAAGDADYFILNVIRLSVMGVFVLAFVVYGFLIHSKGKRYYAVRPI